MARINLEDQFWLEITGVALAMGNQDLAVGNAVRFFRYAQEKAKYGKFLTEEEFKSHGFSEALFPSFAVRTDGGIQAAGYEKHFGWLALRVEAGRKGGSKPKQTKAKPSKTSKGKQTEPSPSPSPSYSYSPSSGLTNAPAEPSPPTDLVLNSEIWKAYSDAYFVRYKTEPVRNAKVNAQVSQLAKRLGAEAPDVARFYVHHNKAFYVGKVHEFGLCLADAEALRTQWATGRKVSAREAQSADQTQAFGEQLKRIREGK